MNNVGAGAEQASSHSAFFAESSLESALCGQPFGQSTQRRLPCASDAHRVSPRQGPCSLSEPQKCFPGTSPWAGVTAASRILCKITFHRRHPTRPMAQADLHPAPGLSDRGPRLRKGQAPGPLASSPVLPAGVSTGSRAGGTPGGVGVSAASLPILRGAADFQVRRARIRPWKRFQMFLASERAFREPGNTAGAGRGSRFTQWALLSSGVSAALHQECSLPSKENRPRGAWRGGHTGTRAADFCPLGPLPRDAACPALGWQTEATQDPNSPES